MATVQEEIKKKQYLNNTNSVMPVTQKSQIADGGVPARGAVAQPYKMPSSLDEAMFGAKRGNPTSVIPAANAAEAVAASKPAAAQPIAAQPGAAPRVENAVVPQTDSVQPVEQEVAAGIKNRTIDSQSFSRGSGVVINNDTGTVQGVGGDIKPPVMRGAPVQQGNAYGAYASDIAKQSQDMMNGDVQSFKAEDGTAVSKGAAAVGAGIVARGLLNRSKAFADMSNQQQTTENAGFGIRSLAEDRNRSAIRDDAKALTDIEGKQMEQAQVRRVNELQEQFLKETDPAKKRQISEHLTALTGKTVDKFQPVIGKDDLGNSVFLGAFDTRSGDYREQGPAMGQQQAPAGMKYVGTSGGRPVFEDANGKRFIQ